MNSIRRSYTRAGTFVRMKHRRLTRDELEGLQPQFVRFLAAQGIDAELWAKLKVTDEARTGQLLDQFSAMVYDDVLRWAEYLEERSNVQLFVYKCGPDKVELRGLIIRGEADGLDFRREMPPAEMAAALQRGKARVQVAQAERAYKPDRETDLFHLLERGAKIAPSGSLWDLIDGITATQQAPTSPPHTV